jgi:hypothetical protein
MGLAMAALAVAPSLPAQASQTTPEDVAQIYSLVNVANFIQALTSVCLERNTELNLDNICGQIENISVQAAHNGRLLVYSINGTYPNTYPLTSQERCLVGTLLDFPYGNEGGFITGYDLGYAGHSSNTHNTQSCGIVNVPRWTNHGLVQVRHIVGLNDVLNHYSYLGGFYVPTPIGNYPLPQGYGIFNVGMAIAQNCGSLGFNSSARSWCRSYYSTLAFESNTVQNYVTFNFGNVPFN